MGMSRGSGNEPVSVHFAFNMTPSERAALDRLAYDSGATLSGMVRRLIRDAARNIGSPRPTQISKGVQDEN